MSKVNLIMLGFMMSNELFVWGFKAHHWSGLCIFL